MAGYVRCQVGGCSRGGLGKTRAFLPTTRERRDKHASRQSRDESQAALIDDRKLQRWLRCEVGVEEMWVAWRSPIVNHCPVSPPRRGLCVRRAARPVCLADGLTQCAAVSSCASADSGIECAARCKGASGVVLHPRAYISGPWDEYTAHCLTKRTPAQVAAMLVQCVRLRECGRLGPIEWQNGVVGDALR